MIILIRIIIGAVILNKATLCKVHKIPFKYINCILDSNSDNTSFIKRIFQTLNLWLFRNNIPTVKNASLLIKCMKTYERRVAEQLYLNQQNLRILLDS